MMRVVCVMDRKNTNKLMEMLGVSAIIEKMAKAAAVRRYGHVRIVKRERKHLEKMH